MDGYTKLHARILTSSIWNEPNHVRILFITLLALADSNGRFEGSPAGLAALARLTVDEAVDALRVLEGPDQHSSDGTTGERLMRLSPGSWEIINHRHYRDKKTRKQIADLERQRKTRQAPKDDATCSNVTPCHTVSNSSVYVSESTDGSTGTERKKRGRKPTAVSKPDDVDQQVWDDWLAVRRAKKMPLTQTALRGVLREAEKARLSLSEAIAMSAQEGWSGFKSDWVGKTQSRNGSKSIKGKVTDALWDGSTGNLDFYRGPGNESVWGDERDD